jgi:hypothetical protein
MMTNSGNSSRLAAYGAETIRDALTGIAQPVELVSSRHEQEPGRSRQAIMFCLWASRVSAVNFFLMFCYDGVLLSDS